MKTHKVKCNLYTCTWCGCDWPGPPCRSTGLASSSLRCQNMGTDNMTHVKHKHHQQTCKIHHFPSRCHMEIIETGLQRFRRIESHRYFDIGIPSLFQKRGNQIPRYHFGDRFSFHRLLNYWRRGPSQDETRLLNQFNQTTVGKYFFEEGF